MQNYHVNKTSLSKLSANTGCRCTDCSGQCHIISNQPEQAAAWRKCAACMKNKYRTVRVIPRDHQDLMTECVRLKPDPNEEELIHKKHWERIVDDVSKDVQRELQRMPSKLYQYSESTKQRIVNERAEYNLYMKSRSAGVCPVRNDFIDVDNVDPLLYRFIDTKLWYKPEGKIETSNAEVRCMLDEGTSFKRFINSYLLMVKQGYCAGANRIETLELLYKYYKKMNTDVPSDLLRLKKLRDIKVQDRINETPMTSFARTLRSLSKLFKRSIWRRERFNKQIKKKFNISDETLRLAEYKGAVTFVEEDKTEAKTLKRLRSDYRSSKTGDDYIKELKLALIKKRHKDDWIKQTEEKKERDKSLIKLQIASKNYGEQLCKLNREEDNLIRNLNANKACNQLLADLFSIHLTTKRYQPINDVSCCNLHEDYKLSTRNLFDASSMVQEIKPHVYFEKLKFEHGKSIFQTYDGTIHRSDRFT